MIKKITLGYSLIYVVILLIYLGMVIFNDKSASSIALTASTYTYVGPSLFEQFITAFTSNNILAFITIIISSYMLHHDETKFIPKIAILESVGYTFLYIIYFLLLLNTDWPEFFSKFIIGPFTFIMLMLLLAYIFIIPLLLILLIEPDNRISEILKKASLGSLGLSLFSGIVLLIQLYLAKPTSLDSYKSYLTALSINEKILVAGLFIMLIALALAHIANYALSGNKAYEEEAEEENIDYAELARQAEMHAQMRQNAVANSIQAQGANVQPAPVTPVAAQPMEAINVPHVEATPTPVTEAPPVDTGLDSLIQSKPLVNESASQNNE